MNSLHPRRVLAASLLSGLAAIAAADESAEPAAASAATLVDASEGGDGVETVTVTARRRTENVQDVPIPIAAIGGEELQRSGQYRLEDLNQRLPSTNVFVSNPRQSSIAVRGLGNNPANDALESSVGVYVDNVYLGRPGMANFDLIDIEQVALLRGPQGTLFGKNTTAGVLNVATRKPTFEPEATFESSLGDVSYWQLRGAVSGPLVGDTLAGRLSVVSTTRDGFIDAPERGDDLNDSRRRGARGQLLWRPSDALEVRFIGDYNRESSDCCVGVIKNLGANGGAAYLARIAATGAHYQFDPDYRTNYINSYQHMSVEQGGASAEATWKLDAGTITSISAWRKWDFVPINDADGTSLSAIINAGQSVRYEQVSQELRFASPDAGPVEYVVGLYGFYQSQDNLLETQYGPDAGIWLNRPQFNDGYTATDTRLHTRSASVFAQGTWHATEALDFTVGVRGTRERKNTWVHRRAPTGPNPAIATLLPEYLSGDLEREDDNVSALLSVSYELTRDTLLYASASRGAKSGGINPAVPPSVAGGLPANETLFIEPEVARDYELGLKTAFLDNRIRLDGNLFWTDVDDYQATRMGIINGVSTQILGNIGGVRTRGVELDFSARPVDRVTLTLAASFNDATYTSYHNAPCPPERTPAPSCDLTGERLYLTPRWIVNPGVSYEHAVGSLHAFGVVNYAWRSSYFGSSDSSRLAELDSYGLLGARVGVRGDWQGRDWSLALWSNNALDETYFLSLSRGANGEYSGQRGLPRTWGATFRVDF